MRGKLKCFIIFNTAPGITPADAGKTCRCQLNGPRIWDHPRGCGENYLLLFQSQQHTGSPPRMRGKPSRIPPKVSGNRITPADAGKTGIITGALLTVGDHPRGCGENRIFCSLLTPFAGSPPRMRGKLYDIPHHDSAHRITPADAGKTLYNVS